KSCPCAVYRVKWSKLAIIRWPLWSSVRFLGTQRALTLRKTLLRWTTVACAPSLLHSSSFSRK
ncbi:hypothetical protein L9F63_000458, partial [Diploptera punctata]